MPFERPTIRDLIDRAISAIETRLPGADARLRRSFENVIAKAVAGLAHGLHGHLFWVSRQLFPDLAESIYLRRWASIWGVDPKEAAKAVGTINVVVATSMPAGTLWARIDGVQFETDTLVGALGATTVDVTAVVSGDDGNTAAATYLTIVTPIAGVDPIATVDGNGLADGLDAESDEDLRTRLLRRIRTPPSGGGPGDYEDWALEVEGVTRAWENGNELGPGTVALRFAVDGESSPIPVPAKVTEVQDYVEARAPITAALTTSAPVDNPLDPTISITPDTAAVRTAVEAEIEALLIRVADTNGTTILWSQINEAISLAEGEVDHTLTVPAADVTPAVGELTSVGTITWV